MTEIAEWVRAVLAMDGLELAPWQECLLNAHLGRPRGGTVQYGASNPGGWGANSRVILDFDELAAATDRVAEMARQLRGQPFLWPTNRPAQSDDQWADSATADTSQLYFLDLIRRIDDVTEEYP